MNDDINKILGDEEHEMDPGKLLKYAENQLPAHEQHDVEAGAANDPFVADALEGLQQLQNPQQANAIVNQLNKGLRKQLKTKKQKRQGIPSQQWVIYAIIILLIIITVAFFIIKRQQG
ncbi:MAG: hypothetical protein ABS68_11405 [Niastella sp. SCN 39-18]|nr:hypothetical protein [Sphingobacteriales bacterium]ODT51759.1 MAG: hypothetical protein ABS68_11405 [Niastella sp. SCN 39-18]OJW10148.1 MAG: hypothetical protein BGO53_06345 [Sphingobacteriales bacterium 39-19]